MIGKTTNIQHDRQDARRIRTYEVLKMWFYVHVLMLELGKAVPAGVWETHTSPSGTTNKLFTMHGNTWTSQKKWDGEFISSSSCEIKTLLIFFCHPSPPFFSCFFVVLFLPTRLETEMGNWQPGLMWSSWWRFWGSVKVICHPPVQSLKCKVSLKF